MSSLVKVKVERTGNRRHRMTFSANLVCELFHTVDTDGEIRWLKVTPAIRERFTQAVIAEDIVVYMHAIWFTRPCHLSLDDVVAGLLDLYTEFIGPRTFIVKMPRPRS